VPCLERCYSLSNKLVVFEGIDGAGSTTMLKATEQACHEGDIPVRTAAQPSETRIGDLIRENDASYSAVTQTLLFVADRYTQLSSPLYIEDGFDGVLLMDRHIDSTIAYQAPQVANELSISVDEAINWIMELHETLQVRTADLTVYVDTPPQTAAQRIHDRDGYEDEGVVADAYALYDSLYDGRENVIQVDGTQSRGQMIDEAAPKVIDAIEDL
jgi:dTMP kinase